MLGHQSFAKLIKMCFNYRLPEISVPVIKKAFTVFLKNTIIMRFNINDLCKCTGVFIANTILT